MLLSLREKFSSGSIYEVAKVHWWSVPSSQPLVDNEYDDDDDNLFIRNLIISSLGWLFLTLSDMILYLH